MPRVKYNFEYAGNEDNKHDIKDVKTLDLFNMIKDMLRVKAHTAGQISKSLGAYHEYRLHKISGKLRQLKKLGLLSNYTYKGVRYWKLVDEQI